MQNVKTGKPVANQEVVVGASSPDWYYVYEVPVQTDSNGHFSVALTWGVVQDNQLNPGTHWYNLYTHTYQNPEVNHVGASFVGYDYGGNPDLSSWNGPIDVSVWGTYYTLI